MASGVMVSGLDRLVEAMEATEAAAAASTTTNGSTSNTNNIKRRNTTVRTMNSGFMCPHPKCGRLFSKRYNQQAHMRIHDGTKPFSCELCGKAFMWKSSLKSHAKMHAKIIAQGIRKNHHHHQIEKKKLNKLIQQQQQQNKNNNSTTINSEYSSTTSSTTDMTDTDCDRDAAIALTMFR